MTTIQAIETRYAGCRFRSRLEARWAVFFDALNIEWVYEPQGYLVGPDQTPYLPDFWLPKPGIWVEVKGAMTAGNMRTLFHAASYAGLPGTPTRPLTRQEPVPFHLQRILILGDVPGPGEAATHVTLDIVGDLVLAQQTVPMTLAGSGALDLVPVARCMVLNPFIEYELSQGFLDLMTKGERLWWVTNSKVIHGAYGAARSARFEHGESG